MKKKNKKNHIRMRFSPLLLCCLAIMLCAAPALKAYENVPADETRDIDYPVTGILFVEGIANLLTGASAQNIYVQMGGTLNMYSGTIIGTYGFINVSTDAAGMTVYGMGFEDELGPVDYGQWTPDVKKGFGKELLTGQYEDGSTINLLILSDNPINLQPPPSLEEITIDIKPGSDLNNINLKSKGVVPVAVLTTEDFDASTIDTDPDTDTVKLAGASPVRWKLCDVDGDGDLDMLFHFKTQELLKSEKNPDGLDENSTEATLTATLIGTRETTDGEVVIQGTDEVCIKPQKKKK